MTDACYAARAASAPAHVNAVRHLLVDVDDADDVTTGRAMAKIAHAARSGV